MKPSIALDKYRHVIREMMVDYKVTNMRVFGSVLEKTDHEGSDLDLLVDTLPGATLFDLGGLQADLEETLGVPVDLLTPGDLPIKFRHLILAQAQPI
jgi:predicted nucleotidyltransferase